MRRKEEKSSNEDNAEKKTLSWEMGPMTMKSERL